MLEKKAILGKIFKAPRIKNKLYTHILTLKKNPKTHRSGSSDTCYKHGQTLKP